MSSTAFPIEEIIERFHLSGNYKDYCTIETGHINNTYLLTFEQDGVLIKRILQKINVSVFKNPDQLMHNIISVTDYLKDKITQNGGNPSRETLDFYKTNDGKYYYQDEQGSHWRCYVYVDDVYSCNSIENPEVFFNAGAAFGTFQEQLSGFPSGELYETIPNFHNTRVRFAALKTAIDENLAGRRETVRDEIEFALSRERDASVVVELLESGEIPPRVTHNDTKLNNVLFDKNTNKAICVIDLDTIMPGSSLYDFGDAIRFGANTAKEDEKDLSKVSLDLGLYEQYVKGYLSTAGAALTQQEIALLPFSAKLMTYECGMRFLTDYLNGDTYFRIAYPEHNLDRCRTQFELVRDIERNYDEMMRITMQAAKK
ncbi:MAG: aminoglycoside phosphotransferase family protein [Oscillospiraceae bacterium]|jgi:Ser/Thr protein kinase RdoA (MazF antagonist)|nr:aminoglycoside phosphotransferase family protein [Oscillospiraceae bacterium]